MLIALTGLALAAWVYLILFRGFFWKSDPKPPLSAEEPAVWPAVAAVVPARNESGVIERSLASLRQQSYAGELNIVLVDDSSEDGTGELARSMARCDGRKVHVISGDPIPPGWTGKLWAMAQGLQQANLLGLDARYIWFTDADIEHDPQVLSPLVRQAEARNLDLNSNMALLHCTNFWETLLIPAFVFFFRKLYPFEQVNDPRHATAAAAGGSMLVRREALQRAGGLEAIRRELIDDCALARLIKAHGPIRLELTLESRSIRPYDFGDIWHMVARSAYTQLRHAPLRLLVTVVGMSLIYLGPWVGLVCGSLSRQYLAIAFSGIAWVLMTLAYLPTIRLYQLRGFMALLLPTAALLYTLMTVDSARRYYQGQGGMWKGRAQA